MGNGKHILPKQHTEKRIHRGHSEFFLIGKVLGGGEKEKEEGGGEHGRRKRKKRKGKTFKQGTIENRERGCVLRYKTEGREFHRRWCHWNFQLT